MMFTSWLPACGSLVVETNQYYDQFLQNSDDGPSPQREVTEVEMLAFLALKLQMGHTNQGRLQDYWTKMEQFFCPFYGQMMARARYYHILRFLHFTDKKMKLTEQMTDCGNYETSLKLQGQTFQHFTTLPNIWQSMKSL